jgi:cytochrome c-type biogenesis protein CcmH
VISTLLVFVVGVLLIGAAAFWTLRAYRDAGGRRMRGSMMACVAVALVGLGIYLLIGRPEIPDQPYAERLEALRHRDPTTFTPDEALAVLGEAARENPRDPLPHFYSGQVLLAQGRAAEAARAYDAALRREPRLAEALMGLGRAMVRIDEGRVSPETIAVFQQAAALTEDPAPWIYQAMGAMEAGQGAEARRLWGEALARMDEDDPRRDMARRMSREAGR